MRKHLQLVVIDSMMDIRKELPQQSNFFLIKQYRDTTSHTEIVIVSKDQPLPNELRRRISRKLEKRKIH